MSLDGATFTFPTPTVYGPGSLRDVLPQVRLMGCKRPLVITDSVLAGLPVFDRLAGILERPKLGRTWELCPPIHSNPLEQDVEAAAETFRAARCDGVIAFGGGSALDVGKVCRLLIAQPNLRLDRLQAAKSFDHLPPCLCIPTTAGPGSEMGCNAVITLKTHSRRVTFTSPCLLPNRVILDPELTVDLPPHLTAATGLDALTHAIEAFTSPALQPFCDGIALEAMRLIVEALPRAFQDGKDLTARGQMLLAASMSGLALLKGLGATHALANPLSALCGMHHGVANAICLPHVMAFNARRKPGLYRRVGQACGLDVLRAGPQEADQMTLEFLRNFIRELGLGQGLRACGVRENQIEALVTQALADVNLTTNPVPLRREDLKAIYLQAL